MSSYYGVILAAGQGSRIYPLSTEIPKPFLPICNKPIIQYQIEYMLELGIQKIFIVCGHLKEKLMGYFGDGSSLGGQIQYVQQDKPLGIAHALSKVEPYIDRPFMLFLGDIFFITKQLGEMIELFEKRKAHGVLAVKYEDNTEYIKRNYAVILHESGMVRRVIEKPRYLQNRLKGCGIYFFDTPIFDAVRRTPRTAMRDEYEITSSIQILVEDGYPVYTADVIEWDINITTIDDLMLCNRKMLESHQGKNVLGKNITLHPNAKIEQSIIGDNVYVKHPICITNSVILPDSQVMADENLAGVLIFKEKIFHCQAKDY